MASNPVATLPPVVKTVVVGCTPHEAFRYFTEDFSKWWPAATHSVVAFASGHKDSPALCALEAKRGGRIYERAANGDEYPWGRIQTWQPPTRLVFSWHPGGPEEQAQTVEVSFVAIAEGTRVTLTHTGWEKLGKDAEAAWSGYNSGWESVFVGSFAGYARQQSTPRD
jgi:uncharacterized protein YndB with AHSA1/START domain